MKTIKTTTLLILLIISINGLAQEKISPYFKLGVFDADISEQSQLVKEALEKSSFKIIGEYHPENNKDLYVIAYTSDELIDLCKTFKDRGLMAAALKVGLTHKEGKTSLSILNPEYLFRAYIYEGFSNYAHKFLSISDKAIASLNDISTEKTPFGGEEKKDKLYKYRYKIMMPYFTDPIELNEYESFSEGLQIIQNNLSLNKGNTAKVYEIIDEANEIAVFGIALYDVEKGEKDFLPVIGEENLSAMPYDIILQGNKVTMLHGKYRFALHWPELSMGTFMKIMSTPRNVERFMEGITK